MADQGSIRFPGIISLNAIRGGRRVWLSPNSKNGKILHQQRVFIVCEDYDELGH
jgi:hypothetical protein